MRAAFAYRRKTLANSLALAGWREDRAAVEAACRAAGVDPRARAEALPPEAFVRAGAGGRVSVLAGVKINLSLRVGAAARRRLSTSSRPCSRRSPLGDALELEPAPRRRGRGARPRRAATRS